MSQSHQRSFPFDGHNPWRHFEWPAIPRYFGKPWFLPIRGAYYR